MRLLMAVLEAEKAYAIEERLDEGPFLWDVVLAGNGKEVLSWLCRERFDALLLHGCLPLVDGHRVLEALWSMKLPCPPRVMILSEPELCSRERLRADCVIPLMASPSQIANLLLVLSAKPEPMLAKATQQLRTAAIEELLDALRLRGSLKGRLYLSWLLQRLVPSPILEHELTATLYSACAAAYGTTPAAVERCVRHAVEEVFTRGSIQGIERYFGMTVDPERGKLTNRAFLAGAAEQLRARIEAQGYSFSRARSPKSMEMHHKPAAPIRV